MMTIAEMTSIIVYVTHSIHEIKKKKSLSKTVVFSHVVLK
jgi:hypothetical protein